MYKFKKKKAKIKNIYLAFKYQLPLSRIFKNFILTKNAWGMFSQFSHHRRDTQKEKVMYNTHKSTTSSAEKMGKKHNKHFSVYKCIYCDGFHIGKNKNNK